MKIFFVDIDGVIYRDGKTNEKVIQIIKKSKNKLVFCTGRGYLRCIDIVESYLDYDSTIIIENGSKIVDRLGNCLFYQDLTIMEKSLIQQLDQKKIEYVVFNSDDSKYYTSFSRLKIPYIKKQYVYFKSFCNEMYKKNMTQITIKFKDMKYQEETIKLFKVLNINYKLSEFYVTINAPSISKKSAIQLYLKKLNSNSNCDDIVIIGNDSNDLEMFDIANSLKVAVIDEYTPTTLIEKAQFLTDFDNLSSVINKITTKL